MYVQYACRYAILKTERVIAMLIKRILSFILVITMLGGMAVFAGAEEAEAAESIVSGRYELLELLGILDEAEGVFSSGTQVTRSGLMKYLSRIAGLTGAADKTYSGSFSDVNDKTANVAYIGIMESLGVINGGGSGLFRPDEPVLVRDAVTVAVRLLGYDIYAEANGGYPTGYFAVANKAGLTAGVGAEGSLKGEEALSFFMNVLTTRLVIQTSWGSTDKIEITEGASYLETVFDMFEETGIVSANELSGLTDPAKYVGEDCVEIDSIIYNAEGLDVNDMLGKKIDFVYTYSEAKNKDARIVWYEDNKSLRSVTIDARSIAEVRDFTVFCDDENGREKEYDFSGTTDVIYNFKAYPGYRFDNIDIKMGYLTLIDNDRSGGYDVIKVTAYEEYVVAGISYERKSITLEDGREIEFPEAEDDCRIYRFGEKATFNDIYDKTVINVISSKEGDYCIIYADGGVISGTVTGYEEYDNYSYITIDDKKYTMSAKADFKPDLGDYGSFYVNVFGEVAARNRAIMNEKYAYLIKIHRQGSDYDGKFLLKLLTSSGIEVLEAAEKITLNGGAETVAEKILKSEELFRNGVPYETGGEEKSCQQLIRYKTDLKGKVNFIRTWEDVMDNTFTPDDSRKDKYDDRFTRDFRVDSSYEAPEGETPNEMITKGIVYYGGNALVFGARFLMGADTPVFIAPPVYSEDNEAFHYKNRGYLKSESTYRNVELYDIPLSYKIGAAVLRISNTSSASAASVYTAERAFVISKISKVYLEDEGAYGLKITGYKQGKEVSYYVKNLELKDYAESYGNGKGIADLKVGDVIQAATDSKGFINGIRILSCYNENTFGYWCPSGSINYANAILCPQIGEVIYKDSGVITVNCKKPVDGMFDKRWDRAYHVIGSSYFYEMDTKKGILKKIKVTDIPEGGMVFMHTANHMLWDVVYYK